MDKPDPMPNLALAVLSACYFILAVTSLSVVGLLVPMGEGLGVSKSEVAYLVSVFSITNAIAAPSLQVAVGDRDRRVLILWGLVAIGIGTTLTGLAARYEVAVLGRMIMAVGAAVVGPMASATGAALVDVSHRGMALGKVFAGMTVATVLGVPLVALGGDLIGWRATLVVLGGLALLVALAVRLVVPETERGKRARFSEVWAILTDRVLAPAISVTGFQMAAQFATYAVIAAYLLEKTGMAAHLLPVALMTFGVGGVLGNFFAMRLIDRVGPDRLILVSLATTGLVFLGLQFGASSTVAMFVLMGAWAVAAMILFAPQQARIIGLRPEMANLLLALNGSAIYAGMAVGSAISGALYASSGTEWLALASASLIALGLGAFLISKR